MGFLDLKIERSHLKIINQKLRPFGLKPYLSEEWEIHGPHQGMNYQVYVGYAWGRFGKLHVTQCVSITPQGIYEIDDPSDWWKTYEDRKL